MNKKAVFVGKSNTCPNQPIFRLEPPHDGYEHVVVSGIKDSWAHETMIFGCDAEGKPDTWLDLFCVGGTTDQRQTLRDFGYDC